MFDEKQFESIKRIMPKYLEYGDACGRLHILQNAFNHNLTVINKTDRDIKNSFDDTYGKKRRNIVISFMTALILGFIVYLIIVNTGSDFAQQVLTIIPVGTAVALYAFIKQKDLKKYMKNAQNQRVYCQKQNVDIEREMKEVQENVNYIFNKISESEDNVIPFDYWMYAREIYDFFETKRADNIKEAINLFEEINHKRRVESLIEQGNREAAFDREMQSREIKRQTEQINEINKTLDIFRK